VEIYFEVDLSQLCTLRVHDVILLFRFRRLWFDLDGGEVVHKDCGCV
jgi:hypothetical protein